MEEEVSERKLFEQDDLSLLDLRRILMGQRKWLLGIPIFCMLLATIGVIMAKPKWEATAVIQIGQVGQSGVGQGSQLFEPPLRAIERMKMKSIEEEWTNLLTIVSKSSETSGDSRFSANLLLSNLLLQKNAELRDFEMRRLAADEQLTSVRTYPTSLIDRIYVPENPASPKKLLVVMLAAVLGLILGIIVAFMRNYWQSAKVPA